MLELRFHQKKKITAAGIFGHFRYKWQSGNKIPTNSA